MAMRGTAAYDGSRPNKCLTHLVSKWIAEKFRGPLLFFGCTEPSKSKDSRIVDLDTSSLNRLILSLTAKYTTAVLAVPPVDVCTVSILPPWIAALKDVDPIQITYTPADHLMFKKPRIHLISSMVGQSMNIFCHDLGKGLKLAGEPSNMQTIMFSAYVSLQRKRHAGFSKRLMERQRRSMLRPGCSPISVSSLQAQWDRCSLMSRCRGNPM